MPFDLKENWPLLAAGAAAIAGLYVFKSGANAGGMSYSVVTPSDAGVQATAQATVQAQATQDSAISQALAEYLNYQATVAQLQEQGTVTQESLLAEEEMAAQQLPYAYLGQLTEGNAAIGAAAAAAQASQPPWWYGVTNILNGIGNAARGVAPFFGVPTAGGSGSYSPSYPAQPYYAYPSAPGTSPPVVYA